MPLDSIQVDTSKSRKDPWLELPAWVHRERIKVYLPWLERCGQIYVIERQYQSLTVVELVILLLIEGYSVRAIGKSWRADPKRLRRAFRQALDGYAELKPTTAA